MYFFSKSKLPSNTLDWYLVFLFCPECFVTDCSLFKRVTQNNVQRRIYVCQLCYIQYFYFWWRLDGGGISGNAWFIFSFNVQHTRLQNYKTYIVLNRAVARTLIGRRGVYIHIFMFCPTDFFSNWSIWIWFEKKLVG